MDSESGTKDRRSTTETALILISLTWLTDFLSAFERIRGHTPLSDDSLRGELLCLRSYAVDVAVQAEVTNEIIRATLVSELYMFHMALTGAFEGSDSYWSSELEKFLESLRSRHPEQYRLMTELRAIAPSGEVLAQRLEVYRAAAIDLPESPDEQTALAFCAFCNALEDATVARVAAKQLDDHRTVASGFLARTTL